MTSDAEPTPDATGSTPDAGAARFDRAEVEPLLRGLIGPRMLGTL